MYKRHLSFIFLVVVSMAISCKKPATPTTPPTPPPPPVVEVEENISFGLDPDPGTTTQPATSAIYSFKVILSSKMPSSGITIDHTTKADPSGVPLGGTISLTSNLVSNEISINQLASGSLYSVTVTVTSKKTASNTLTKTFKVARK